jgi:hypothetical protein
MTKKGPLSKAEKFYIQNHLDLDVKSLCTDLDRAQTTVNKFVDTLPQSQSIPDPAPNVVIPDGQPPNTVPSQRPKGHIEGQFARPNDDRDSGVVVMTPNAAEASDEAGKGYRAAARAARKNASCVTSIKG